MHIRIGGTPAATWGHPSTGVARCRLARGTLALAWLSVGYVHVLQGRSLDSLSANKHHVREEVAGGTLALAWLDVGYLGAPWHWHGSM